MPTALLDGCHTRTGKVGSTNTSDLSFLWKNVEGLERKVRYLVCWVLSVRSVLANTVIHFKLALQLGCQGSPMGSAATQRVVRRLVDT